MRQWAYMNARPLQKHKHRPEFIPAREKPIQARQPVWHFCPDPHLTDVTPSRPPETQRSASRQWALFRHHSCPRSNGRSPFPGLTRRTRSAPLRRARPTRWLLAPEPAAPPDTRSRPSEPWGPASIAGAPCYSKGPRSRRSPTLTCRWGRRTTMRQWHFGHCRRKAR